MCVVKGLLLLLFFECCSERCVRFFVWYLLTWSFEMRGIVGGRYHSLNIYVPGNRTYPTPRTGSHQCSKEIHSSFPLRTVRRLPRGLGRSCTALRRRLCIQGLEKKFLSVPCKTKKKNIIMNHHASARPSGRARPSKARAFNVARIPSIPCHGVHRRADNS